MALKLENIKNCECSGQKERQKNESYWVGGDGVMQAEPGELTVAYKLCPVTLPVL